MTRRRRRRLMTSRVLLALAGVALATLGCSSGPPMDTSMPADEIAEVRPAAEPIWHDAALVDPHAVVPLGDRQDADQSARVHPGTGQPYRLYYYYPNSQVYLDVRRGVYFWRSNGAWRSGSYLPRQIRLSWSDYERIGLATAHPFEVHSAVVRRYPDVESLRRQARGLDRQPSGWPTVNVPTDR